MRIGVVLPTYDQFGHGETFRRLVAAIEDLGYDSAWFGDHIVLPEKSPDYIDPRWLEALTCAIQGLGMTSRLKFGTDVLVAPYRNPITLAKMAATASELSSGRLLLGMGIGWLEEEFEALGAPPFAERARATEEYLTVMRLLFEQEGPLNFEGQWINFRDIHFEPKSAAPPPLLVGGNHSKALTRAALLGDGWHPLFMDSEGYAKGRAEILRIREDHGITRPFLFSYSCPQTKILAASEATSDLWSEKASKGSSYAPGYPRSADGRPRFAGTPAQLTDDCKAFAEAGVELLVVRFAVTRDKVVNVEAYMDQLRLFAKNVLPHFPNKD